MFEKKPTVKLDQDKGKFLSKNADSKPLNNPFVKRATNIVGQKMAEDI